MKCNNCGAHATAEQARMGQCHYCGAALPRASKGPDNQVDPRLLEDRDGDGIPDGLQALAALQAAQQKLQEQQEAEDFRRSEILQLKQRLEKVSLAVVSPWDVLIKAVLLGFVISIPYHLIAVRWLRMDPWFGAHSATFCPLVCSNCQGPYVTFSWVAYSTPESSSGESTLTYCQQRKGQFAGYTESQFLSGIGANKQYQLPGDTWTLWFSSLVVLIALMLPVGYVVERRGVRSLHAQAPDLERKIRELEAV